MDKGEGRNGRIVLVREVRIQRPMMKRSLRQVCSNCKVNGIKKRRRKRTRQMPKLGSAKIVRQWK